MLTRRQRCVHPILKIYLILMVGKPEPILFGALFQSQPAEAAGETFNTLFTSLRDTLSRKAESRPLSCSCSQKESSSSQTRTPPAKAQDSAEIERLQVVVSKLRADLGKRALTWFGVYNRVTFMDP